MRLARLFLGTLLLGLAPVALAAYPDVPADHDSARVVQYMQDHGIMEGYPNGTFGPNLTLNRAELMKILVEAKVGTPSADQYRDCFPDVTNQWFAPYVCFAVSQEWVAGYPDGTFKPAQPVNMVEALKMLVNARGYTLADLDGGWYGDVWWGPYLETAMRNGIVTFYPDPFLDKPLPRIRIAEFLYMALLNDGKLEFALQDGDCGDRVLTGIDLRWYTAKSYPDSTATTGHDFIGIDAEGGTCTLARDVNPFSGVSKEVRFSLAALEPRADTSTYSTDDTAPVVNGKAYFTSICECDGGSPDGLWELDVGARTLTEFPNPGVALISPDYRYFVSVSEQEIHVLDRVTGRTALAASVAWPSRTFIKKNFGPKDGLSGGVELGKFTLDGTVIRYEVYDSRPHGKDDVADYTFAGTESVDFGSLFLR